MLATAPRLASTARRRQAEAEAPEADALEWRIIRDPPHAGSRNMALDHALARCVAPGSGVVRLYGWERPTVSFGRNEPAAGLYSVRAAHERGIDYVRRPTGGRAVLHAGELTYAVVAPVRALGGARIAYRRINEALAAALRSLGAGVELSAGGAALAPDAGPCFQSPVEGEVVVADRKLVGSAQARIDGALLQHGAIILSGDQSVLAELSDGAGDHRTPATLQELIGAVRVDDVAAAVTEKLQMAFGGSWSASEYRAAEIAEADRLEVERYARDSWTWRR